MNRTHAVIGLLALTIAASGCVSSQENPSGNQAEEELTENIDTTGITPGTSFWAEMKATEANQQQLTKEEPIPAMEDSLERQNLKQRYQTLNDQNEIFHVYLMSHGKVVSYFAAQGKVSSVNSKLTQPQQLVRCRSGDQGRYDTVNSNDQHCVVSSPQLDGSYGTNGDGVFFFTTDGSYVEWNGEYVVSERPLNINTPLSLEAQVNVSQ